MSTLSFADAVSSPHLQRPRESKTEYQDQEEKSDVGKQEEEGGATQEEPSATPQESEIDVES